MADAHAERIALARCAVRAPTAMLRKENGGAAVFIAMNQFKVNPERGQDFEATWRTRESYLQGFDGFQQFALLRGDEPGDYISHTTWASREAFLAWTQSDAFRKAHGGGMAEGIIEGHPRARFYDAVIVESGTAAATR